MAFIVIDKQLFFVFDLFQSKNTEQSNVLQISRVVFIRQVSQKIFGKVVNFNAHLTEADIRFIARRRVVDHMSDCIGIMIGGIYPIMTVFSVQTERTLSLQSQISQLQNFPTWKMDMLWLSIILFPFLKRYTFEILEIFKDLSWHQTNKGAHSNCLMFHWQDCISSSSTCNVFDLTLSYNRLKAQIIAEISKIVVPKRSIYRRIFFQVPNWKFIRVYQFSGTFICVAINYHFSASTVFVQMMKKIEQIFDMCVISIFFLLGHGHIQNLFLQNFELSLRVIFKG